MGYLRFIQCGDQPVNTMGSFALAFLWSSASIPAVLEVTSCICRWYAGMTLLRITGIKAAPGSMPVISSVPAWLRSAMLVMPFMYFNTVMPYLVLPWYQASRSFTCGLIWGLLR